MVMEGALPQQDRWPSAAQGEAGRARWPLSVDKGLHGCIPAKDIWLHLDSLTCMSPNVGAQKPVEQNHQLASSKSKM